MLGASPDGVMVKNPPTSAGDVGDTGSTHESGRALGGGNDSSLQYSCLENLRGQRGLLGSSPWGPQSRADCVRTRISTDSAALVSAVRRRASLPAPLPTP